jgi:hypothetical protein
VRELVRRVGPDLDRVVFPHINYSGKLYEIGAKPI